MSEQQARTRFSRLAGQAAIVTGAGSGIGRGIAEVLASAGVRVIVADIDLAGASVTADRILSSGGTATAAHADVANPGDAGRLYELARQHYDGIEIVVSNAGIYPIRNLSQIDTDEWAQVIDVNLTGAFHLLRAMFPTMREQGYGRFVVTSSITGPITAMPFFSHYSASKAGLIGLARSAALEGAPDGVTVNAVLPGTIETESILRLGGENFVEEQRANVPVGRLGTAHEIGHAVKFLASPDAGFITGTTLIVDGGQTIREGQPRP